MSRMQTEALTQVSNKNPDIKEKPVSKLENFIT